jgi:acyl dehydratase
VSFRLDEKVVVKMADAIPFDDLDAINAVASDEFGEFGDPIEVTQEMIQEFADLTGDQQWIHVDVERARKESPFGAPIAHGFLTLSLLPRLSRTAGVAVSGHTNAGNYGAEGLRFLSPVPSGSKVAARARVVRAEAKSGGTLLTTEFEIRVVGAEKPALLYRMQVLYR